MEQVQIDSKFADKNGEIMVIELGGHIDQSNSYQLQKMFDNIIHSRCFKVIVDFDKLYYMSSAGWGVFIGEIKHFRNNGGDIKLANMNSDIYDVFQMLEFYHILEDYASVREAASSFSNMNEELDLFSSQDSTKDDQGSNIENQMTISPITPKVEKDEDEFVSEGNDNKVGATLIDFVPSKSKTNEKSDTFSNDEISKSLEQDYRLYELPLTGKIKKIVAENPLIGPFGIKKVLKHEHFGHTKVGIIKLWKILKDLNLDSKDKRYRFYRSA